MKTFDDSTWTVQAFDQHPGMQWFALVSLLILAVGLLLATIALRLRLRRRDRRPVQEARRFTRGVVYPVAATGPRWFPVLDQTTEMTAVDDTVVLTRAGAR